MLTRSLLKSLCTGALVATAALASPAAAAQTRADDDRFRNAQQRFDREYQIFRREADIYAGRSGRGQYAPTQGGDYRRAPDAYGYEDEDVVYDPARDYRAGGQYRERVVNPNERVYAGYDGRYYCRRSDGTTGLIIGGVAGGLLGNVIDGGRSRILGTLLGGGAGALAGRAVEQSGQVRCR